MAVRPSVNGKPRISEEIIELYIKNVKPLTQEEVKILQQLKESLENCPKQHTQPKTEETVDQPHWLLPQCPVCSEIDFSVLSNNYGSSRLVELKTSDSGDSVFLCVPCTLKNEKPMPFWFCRGKKFGSTANPANCFRVGVDVFNEIYVRR